MGLMQPVGPAAPADPLSAEGQAQRLERADEQIAELLHPSIEIGPVMRFMRAVFSFW